MSPTSTSTSDSTRIATSGGARQLVVAQRVTSPLDAIRPVAFVAMRVAFGVLLLMHGLDKFDTGLGNVAGAFDGWGVPIPELSARFVAVFEVVGGVALIIGFATRLVAVVMIGILLGAIFFAKFELGLLGGWETDLAYIAGLAAIVVTGPGRLSLDQTLSLERT